MAGLDSTSATCVWYRDGDILGKVLAYASLVPFMAVLFAASVAYSRRTVRHVLVFAGFVATEVLARTLKHWLRQPRPVDRCQALGVCDSHGMPSSHASCMAFAAGARLLHAVFSSQQAADKLTALAQRLWAALEVAALSALVGVVALSRVYLGYHSAEQVGAGVALGLAMAACWHAFAAVAAPFLSAALPQTLLGRLVLLQPDARPAAPHKRND